jgi:polyisoprenoid-binding protein YceI
MEPSVTTNKTKWDFDLSHTEIGFKVKHLMIANVRGVFKEYGGDIYTSDEDFNQTEINFWLNTGSIYTGDEKRDAHLRSADFFELEAYEKMKFTSRTFERTGKEGMFELSGDLTIKNIIKPIKLDVEFGGMMKDPWGNLKAIFTVNGKINRKDWQLNWNAALESGGFLVSDEVWINCEVELVKQLS